MEDACDPLGLTEEAGLYYESAYEPVQEVVVVEVHAAIPEPATFALVALAGMSLLGHRR